MSDLPKALLSSPRSSPHSPSELADKAANLEWRFAGLAAAELLLALSKYLTRTLGHDRDIGTDTDTVTDTTTNTIDVNAWQLCWLQNDGHPVIGLLPKMSWTVYPKSIQPLTKDNHPIQSSKAAATTIDIIKQSRSVNTPTLQVVLESYPTTYSDWIVELIDYSKTQLAADSSVQESPDAPIFSDAANQYNHGFMGFIGYDIAAKHLSPKDKHISLAEQPSAFMGHYDITLRPCANGWQLRAQVETDERLVETIATLLTQFDGYLSQNCPSQEFLIHDPLTQNSEQSLIPPCTLDSYWHYSDYQQAFAQTQQYLRQGDCYQINLTQTWQGTLPSPTTSIGRNHATVSSTELLNPSSLLDYLPRLTRNTQAPFAGYVRLADFELLSCSPELFLVFEHTPEHQLTIRTKPIKGTRPRGRTPEHDAALKVELAESEKDRAENVMIVDLLRNDLGKYAQTGSVKVPQLFAIESFSNVHHMVSTVTALIGEDVHPLTVLFDSLPAGSITGTPKKRAVEIIAELEAAPRGAYCGTLGYMNFDGSGQWNVLIRTLQANRNNEVSLWAGGGITVSSDCAAEYQECLDKVGNLLAVLANSS